MGPDGEIGVMWCDFRAIIYFNPVKYQTRKANKCSYHVPRAHFKPTFHFLEAVAFFMEQAKKLRRYVSWLLIYYKVCLGGVEEIKDMRPILIIFRHKPEEWNLLMYINTPAQLGDLTKRQWVVYHDTDLTLHGWSASAVSWVNDNPINLSSRFPPVRQIGWCGLVNILTCK